MQADADSEWRGLGRFTFHPRSDLMLLSSGVEPCQHPHSESRLPSPLMIHMSQLNRVVVHDTRNKGSVGKKREDKRSSPVPPASPLLPDIPTNAGQANPGAGGSHYSRQFLEWGRVERLRPRSRTVWYCVLQSVWYRARRTGGRTERGYQLGRPSEYNPGIAVGELIVWWDWGRHD